MKQLLIVAHVPSQNTLLLRDAVLRGARHKDVADVYARALTPFEAGPEAVQSADAIILGTTENLGYMSGALKDFFDRTYYGVLEKKQGLPYALYVRAGHDGTGTRRGVESIIAGLRWKEVQPPLIFKGKFSTTFTGECENLGLTMAAGLEAGVF